jgi:uncharacterized membrane protein YidH (DUF202 family)
MWKFAAQILDKDSINIPKIANPGDSNIQNALNVFYAVIGAIAMLLLIIAALRYSLSSGDPNKTAEAKRMIAYTLVGMIVIALAATITEVVLKA